MVFLSSLQSLEIHNHDTGVDQYKNTGDKTHSTEKGNVETWCIAVGELESECLDDECIIILGLRTMIFWKKILYFF